MSETHSAHTRAVAQGLFVAFLWATSWVLIKLGLQADLPALSFAGLRYSLAFLCLLPVLLLRADLRRSLQQMPGRTWLRLALLGLIVYAAAQGGQFVALAYLPSATLSLLLNFTPLLVAGISAFSGREAPGRGQWLGIGLALAGTGLYFWPLNLPAGQALGWAAGFLALLSNSIGSLMGRRVNAEARLSPLVVTAVSMGVGGFLMLAVGGATQGLGQLGPQQWAIIAWLALVNTAFAFTLWNHSMRTLTAVESSVINSTMLPQIALLTWWFLGEALTARQVAGLALVAVGILVVQVWGRRR